MYTYDRDAKIAATVLKVDFQSISIILLEALMKDIISVDEFELKLDELASIAGLPKDRVVEIKRIGKILKG
ncbi:MAG: hypothetical protein HY929_09175 [Euryarchaeota archaeon]|nr:hypothetical protein [Euryarchaeota archaeon]